MRTRGFMSQGSDVAPPNSRLALHGDNKIKVSFAQCDSLWFTRIWNLVAQSPPKPTKHGEKRSRMSTLCLVVFGAGVWVRRLGRPKFAAWIPPPLSQLDMDLLDGPIR